LALPLFYRLSDGHTSDHGALTACDGSIQLFSHVPVDSNLMPIFHGGGLECVGCCYEHILLCLPAPELAQMWLGLGLRLLVWL